MRTTLLALLFCSVLFAKEPTVQKYYSNPSSSLMGFILLNHSKIFNEIHYGEGEFLQSLLVQKPVLDLETVRAISSIIKDPYLFAKTVSEL